MLISRGLGPPEFRVDLDSGEGSVTCDASGGKGGQQLDHCWTIVYHTGVMGVSPWGRCRRQRALG